MYSSPYVELNSILFPKYERKQLIDQLNMYFYLTRLPKAEDKSLMRSLNPPNPHLIGATLALSLAAVSDQPTVADG